MAEKQIKDFTETTNPEEQGDLLVSSVSGLTLKAKLVNLLKRVFRFDDVYDDYMVNVHTLGQAGGNSAPTLTLYRDNLWFYEFPISAQVTEGFFMIHLTHDMKPDTDMTFHIHWTHNNATPSGDVKWNIEFTYARGYSLDTFGPTVTLSTVQTAGPQYTHHITNDDDMVINAATYPLEPDGVIMGRIFRDSGDAADTFNNGAHLMQVDLHYVKSRTGTKERNRPFTSGGF